MSLGQIKRVIAGVVRNLNTNHIVSFAAALSYYFVMAFFPALITLAAIVAYLPIPDLFDTIINTMARFAPPESMGLIRQIAADVITPSRGALLSLGLIGTLWTCSSGFAEIIEALNLQPILQSPVDTLSGGELQRTAIAGCLSRDADVYILDEPTTGLSFADIDCLLRVLQRLVSSGNTVIIIEHNLDVIKNADHIIDLGPGAGDEGGYLIAEGTPEEVAGKEDSATGRYLKEVLTDKRGVVTAQIQR